MAKEQKAAPVKEGETRQINPGVGSENDSLIKRRNDIADRADAAREADMQEVPDEPVVAAAPEPEPEPEPTPEPDDKSVKREVSSQVRPEEEPTPEPEPVVAAEPEPEPTPEPPKKYKLKVNGREREVSEDELVAIAQKVDSADQYLSMAKETFRTSLPAEPSPAPPVKEVKTDVPNEEPTDFVALARRLQMGTEEEAAEALRQLSKPRPSVTPDDVGRVVEQRMSLRRELDSLEDEQSEILKHPKLSKVFRLRLSELSQQNPKMLLSDAYRQVGSEIKEDFGELLKPPAQPEKTPEVSTATQTKLDRKASVPQVPSAATRQQKPAEEDVEETPSQLIARMAKGRHQEKPTFHPGPVKQ